MINTTIISFLGFCIAIVYFFITLSRKDIRKYFFMTSILFCIISCLDIVGALFYNFENSVFFHKISLSCLQTSRILPGIFALIIILKLKVLSNSKDSESSFSIINLFSILLFSITLIGGYFYHPSFRKENILSSFNVINAISLLFLLFAVLQSSKNFKSDLKKYLNSFRIVIIFFIFSQISYIISFYDIAILYDVSFGLKALAYVFLFTGIISYMTNRIFNTADNRITEKTNTSETKSNNDTTIVEKQLEDSNQIIKKLEDKVKKSKTSFSQISDYASRMEVWVEKEVTQRKQAVFERDLANEINDNLMNYIPSVEYWIGVEGNIMLITPSVEAITGYTTEDIREDPGIIGSMIHEEDKSYWQEIAFHSLKGSEKDLVIRIIKKDGSELKVLYKVSRIYDEDGNDNGIRGSFYPTDIDLNKLTKQESKLPILVNNSDILLIKDDSFQLIYSNYQFKTIFNIKNNLSSKISDEQLLSKIDNEMRHSWESLISISKLNAEDTGILREYHKVILPDNITNDYDVVKYRIFDSKTNKTYFMILGYCLTDNQQYTETSANEKPREADFIETSKERTNKNEEEVTRQNYNQEKEQEEKLEQFIEKQEIEDQKKKDDEIDKEIAGLLGELEEIHSENDQEDSPRRIGPSKRIGKAKPLKSDEIIDIIKKSGEIPSISVIASELMELIVSKDVSMGKIAELVQSDPAITVKILKVVNSAYYSLSRQIETTKMALVILGTKEINNIILSVSMLKVFEELDDNDIDFDQNTFWKHSVETAHIASFLGKKLGLDVHGEEFTAGLIHDLGKLLFVQHFPEKFKQVVLAMKLKDMESDEAEDRYIGTAHTEIGSWLAQNWKLPGRLVDSIKWHHHPESALENQQLIALINVADNLSKMFEENLDESSIVDKIKKMSSWNILSEISGAITPENLFDGIDEELKKSKEFISMMLSK